MQHDLCFEHSWWFQKHSNKLGCKEVIKLTLILNTQKFAQMIHLIGLGVSKLYLWKNNICGY